MTAGSELFRRHRIEQHQTIRILDRQFFQQHRIDHAEQSGVGADT
jgi:hypothetical protein